MLRKLMIVLVAAAAVGIAAFPGVSKAAVIAPLPSSTTNETGNVIPAYYYRGHYYRYRWHGAYYPYYWHGNYYRHRYYGHRGYYYR
jgi:hypothetical protein